MNKVPGQFTSIIRFELCLLDVYNIYENTHSHEQSSVQNTYPEVIKPLVQFSVFQIREPPPLMKAAPFFLNKHADSVSTTNDGGQKAQYHIKLKH